MDTFKNCQRPTHTFQTIPIMAHVYLMVGQVLEKMLHFARSLALQVYYLAF